MSHPRMQKRAEAVAIAEALVAAAEARIASSGPCRQCDVFAEQLIAVCIHHAMSGPGTAVYYCIPCARVYARSLLAPEWLREDLDVIDAAAAATRGSAADDAEWRQYLIHVSECRRCARSGLCSQGQGLYEAWTAAKAAARQAPQG